MTNPFSNIISADFKQLYNDAIDSILENNALTVPCTLRYSGEQFTTLCTNCIYDPISKLSANKYNGTGPKSFAEGTICPVCQGIGLKKSDATETIYLAVIFDSKYWLNWSSDTVKIADGMVQTICKASLAPKIKNANEIVFDTNIEPYGSFVYERAGDINPAGLGSNRYIFTMWNRK